MKYRRAITTDQGYAITVMTITETNEPVEKKKNLISSDAIKICSKTVAPTTSKR